MKTTHARRRFFSRVLLAFALLGSWPALADTTIVVGKAWIRLAPPGAMMLAGYAEIANQGDAPVRINRASSDAFGVAEFHRTVDEGGVSRMRPAGVLEIAPGETLQLVPGGLHLMLMQPRGALPEGRTVVVDLLTETGEIVPAVFTVRRGD